MSKRTRYITITLILETMLLSVCGYYIYGRVQNQQAKTNIIILDKKNLLFPQIAGLKYFYEPKPNTIRKDTIEWLHESKKQTINSDSLNSATDFTPEKKSGTYRILTLGDSFTYGLYVNTNENWSERLAQKLNRTLQCPSIASIEVINLGFPGYDIQHALYRYKIRGIKYNPDVIIWLLKEDDFNQFTEISKKLADKKTAGIAYTSKSEQIDDYIKYLQQSVVEIEKRYSQREIAAIQNRFFSEFSTLFSGILILATMPYTSDIYKHRMQEWATIRKNTIFLDNFTNILETDKQPDGHPNEKGHQKIADDVYDVLEQTIFANCSIRATPSL